MQVVLYNGCEMVVVVVVLHKLTLALESHCKGSNATYDYIFVS